jgi:hypothetical protein
VPAKAGSCPALRFHRDSVRSRNRLPSLYDHAPRALAGFLKSLGVHLAAPFLPVASSVRREAPIPNVAAKKGAAGGLGRAPLTWRINSSAARARVVSRFSALKSTTPPPVQQVAVRPQPRRVRTCSTHPEACLYSSRDRCQTVGIAIGSRTYRKQLVRSPAYVRARSVQERVNH